MRTISALATAALVIPLSGCSLEEVAATAADAAACQALSSTLAGIADAYQQGLVDSGVLSQIDALIGDQLDGVLSSGLAQDLGNLTDALAQTETAAGAQQQVEELLASINDRCAGVGINLNQ